MQVIWDTGSGNFLVRSSFCTNCSNDRSSEPWFDVETTTSIVVTSDEDSTTYISGDTLEGFLVYDDVCPLADRDSCAEGFRFVAIHTQAGIDGQLAGVLGMWSGNSPSLDQEEMFMNKMVETSLIDKNIFSFYLTGVDGDSYIDFGEPNPAAMSDPADLVYMDVIDDTPFWTEYVTGIRFETGVDSNGDLTYESYSIPASKSETDSGSSCIIGPTKYINTIRDKIVA